MNDKDRKCGRCGHTQGEHLDTDATCVVRDADLKKCECEGFIPSFGMEAISGAGAVLILTMVATNATELSLKQEGFTAPGVDPADYEITVKKL